MTADEFTRMDKRMDELRADYKQDVGEIKTLLHGITTQMNALSIEVASKLSTLQAMDEKHVVTTNSVDRAFKIIEKHDDDLKFYKGAIWAITGFFGLFLLVASWYMAEQHHKVEKVYEFVIKEEAVKSRDIQRQVEINTKKTQDGGG